MLKLNKPFHKKSEDRISKKNPKYANIFIITNKFKHAFICCQRIYVKIRSYWPN